MTDAMRVALLELETAVRAYETLNEYSRAALAEPAYLRDELLKGFDERIMESYADVTARLKRLDELRATGQA